MSIIRPRVWTQQPQVPVEVDWASPLAMGLVFAYDAATGECVSRRMPVLSSRVSKVASTSGVSSLIADDSGIGQNILFDSIYANLLLSASEYTVDITFRPYNTDQSYHLFGSWNEPNNFWLVAINGTGLIWVAADDNVSNRARWDASSIFTSYKTHRLILSWRGGANKSMWLDGVNKTSSLSTVDWSATTTGSSPAATYLHIGPYVSGQACNTEIISARIYKRGMQDAEISALASNNWQIFRPRVT